MQFSTILLKIQQKLSSIYKNYKVSAFVFKDMPNETRVPELLIVDIFMICIPSNL